jgi:hypothetical protein
MTTFHLGDLLSVTTGKLVSPSHIADVHRLLDHMTGDELFTHQLPRAFDECRPALLAQYPFLAEIEAPEFRDEEHVWHWLAEQVQAHGAEFEVQPLDPADHTYISPFAEIRIMAPHMTVIPVVLDGEPS